MLRKVRFEVMVTMMRLIEHSPVVLPVNDMFGLRQGQWIYQNYAAIPEDGHRYEIIEGVLYMSPAPNLKHQKIVVNLVSYLQYFVEISGLGEVYVSPVDVELSSGTVVQPDVVVILKKHLDRLTDTRIIGAPDLVIEVASPSTANHDRQKKQAAYAKAGVPEYWLVHPKHQTIEVLVLQGSLYYSLGSFSGCTILPSQIIPDLPVNVEQFFPKQ